MGADLLFVEHNRQMRREECEVPIGGVDRQPVPHAHSADKKISIRALDSFTPAYVEKPGRRYVVFTVKWKIREGPQVLPQAFKLPLFPDTGQDFLADWPQHVDTGIANQTLKFLDFTAVRRPVPPQSKGPYARVSNDHHRLALCAL